MKNLAAIVVCFALAATEALAQGAGGHDLAAVGRSIAAAINARNAEALLKLIDVDEIARTGLADIKLGANQERAAREGLANGLRTNIGLTMKSAEAQKGVAKYVRMDPRNATPMVLVRIDMSEGGTEYMEYYLSRASGRIVDWYTYASATLYSESLRFNLATLFQQNTVVARMLGVHTVSETDLKPFTQLVEHLRGQNFAAAYAALENFPEAFRKSRQWALMRVTYGSRAGDDKYRPALRHLAASFGGDGDLTLILLDHYIFENQHAVALQRLDALEARLGGADGSTAHMRGGVLSQMGRMNDAAQACRRGMEIEPDNQRPYWCLIDIGIAAKAPKVTIEGLNAYEKAFNMRFDPAKLAQAEGFQEFARTAEFAAWAKARGR